MTAQHKLLIVLLLVISGTGLISCGPQKFSSGTGGATFASTSTTGTKPTTNCGADTANLSDYGVRLQTYISNGTELNNYIRIKFDRFPFGENDPTTEFMFWVYDVDANGNVVGQQAARFFAEYRDSSGVTHKTQTLTSIKWSELGITSNSIVEAIGGIHFVIILEGALAQSEVVQITSYKGDDDNAWRVVEALLPKYLANPNEYMASKPVQLHHLHPLLGIRGNSLSSTQFQAEMQKYCF